MKTIYETVLLVAFIGIVVSQSLNDIDVDDVKKKLGDLGVDGLPDFDKFNTTNIPSAEAVENTLREKCKKKGAEYAVDKLKDEQNNVKTCIEKYVNFTLVQEELEKAKETGSMDEVFGKYCKMWPSIYECFENATSTARLCMDEKEETAFNKSLDILAELQEFMCFKDGDRLAMFVAEGGVECVKERQEEVQNCINATLGTRMPSPDDLSVATLPTFLFSAKDCEDFDKVRVCVNEELEKCKDSTPANIVDAFFKFLKKHMPCGGAVAVAETKVNKDGSWSITSNILLIVIALLCLKLH